MKRRSFVLTVALLAACSESGRNPTSPGLPPDLVNQDLRVFWARGVGPGVPRGDLTYHGGDVITASKTSVIFWGSAWNNASFAGDKITGLTAFFQGWGNSTYAGTLTQYTGLNGQVTAASTYLGSVIDPTGTPNPGQVVEEACSVVDVPDPVVLYLVYATTARGNAPYCGFHTWTTCKRHPMQVAWLWNLDGDGGCDPGDNVTTHSQGLAALASVTAHELAETITDPRGLGWYAVSGTGEIGDKCNFIFSPSVPTVTFSNGSVWHAQGEWSNAANDAATGYANSLGEPGCIWS